MKRVLWVLFLINGYAIGHLRAQTTASFNFSLNTQSVSGWTNVHGDPSVAVRTATSPSGIAISSMATANWAGFNSTAAFDGGGASGGSFFPSAVTANLWYQYSSFYGAYNAAVPQLEISGLNIDSVYTVKITGSLSTNVPNVFNLNPVRYTVAGTSVYGFIDVNGNFNTSDGATFHNIAPDASGKIHVFVNTLSTTNLAGISGLQIVSGHTAAPTPTVAISRPTNNDIIPEDGSVTIAATASETGGTIARLEFYADTTLLGVDSSAPYSFVWSNPDPGNYAIKVRAVDGTGNISSTTINISVESLNYFWSTTGNIAVNGDSNFLGTVDSSRLVIRTKNTPRMSIDSTGKVDIGLTHPTTPNFRIYDNGDLTAGTTMDRSINSLYKTGLRYYGKSGIMQIGASDRLDTTRVAIVYGVSPSSGIIINTDSNNNIGGKMLNSVFAGGVNTIDSGSYMEDCFIGTHGSHFTNNMQAIRRSLVGAYAITISAPVDASLIVGLNHTISKPIADASIFGYLNQTLDTSYNSLVSGGANQFGGADQFVTGRFLINRTPAGATLGSSNVDFASLSFTGLQGMKAPGIAGYPLFAIGNGPADDGSIRSNAVTVLFNGRTQINSAGYNHTLAQADVTPKAALEVVSTNSGVLLPKLTTAQRNAIVSGDLVNGLLLYNTDSSSFQFYNGSAWGSLTGGAAGAAGGWGLSGNASTNPTGNFIGTTDAQPLVFKTDGVQNMTILANGSVGIGTATLPASDAKLAVDGVIYTTKLRVTLSGWPDYVFKPNYNLPGLPSVERFIRENGHLPGMVSALEVHEKGLDVGANQSVLLRKIEELTLYLINQDKGLTEQNRQLKQQAKQLEEQQKEIEMLKVLIMSKTK